MGEIAGINYDESEIKSARYQHWEGCTLYAHLKDILGEVAHEVVNHDGTREGKKYDFRLVGCIEKLAVTVKLHVEKHGRIQNICIFLRVTSHFFFNADK